MAHAMATANDVELCQRFKSRSYFGELADREHTYKRTYRRKHTNTLTNRRNTHRRKHSEINI